MTEFRANDAAVAARFDRRDALILVLLCAATAIVLGKDITVGGLHDPDSAAHAMDGVLIHDWIAAGGDAISSPMAFAREQYGHYPTLGIGKHYPPGFAIVEAAFFGVLGLSPVTARLCVLFFGVVAAAGIYRFVRGFAEKTEAALSAMVIVTMPATTIWGRQVMLEVPTLAVLVWAAVGFQWYLRRTSWGRLTIVVLLSLLTVSFKQPAVFLTCAMAGAMVLGSLRGRVPACHALAAVVVGGASLGGVFLLVDNASLRVFSLYDSFANRWGWTSLTYYATVLPSQVGVVVLLLAVAGPALVRREAADVRNILLCWLGVVYVMVTVASLKTPRFIYVGLLPIGVFAGISIARMLRALPGARLRCVGAGGACAVLCTAAMGRSIEHAPNYGPVVAAHKDAIDGEVILFSGLRDGDFVFAAREQLPRGRTIVLRGSKVFYTCVARPKLDLARYVDSKEELIERMREFAFRFVFVERQNHVGTEPDAWLREYLAEGTDYRRVSSYEFPCHVEDSDRGDVTIDVYELTAGYQRSVDYYDIPMPRTGKPIRVRLPKQVALAETGG